MFGKKAAAGIQATKPVENVNRCAVKLNVTWRGSATTALADGWHGWMDEWMVDKHRNLFYGENIMFCVCCVRVVCVCVCMLFGSRRQTKY